MKTHTLFLIVFLMAILVTSGCARTDSAGVNQLVTTIQPKLSPVIPGTTYATPVLTAIVTYQKFVPPSLTAVPATSTRIATDNPYLEYMNFRKQLFDFGIPNCPMADAFPAIVNDTAYGIKQREPKLTTISEDEYRTFLRKYTEGNAENTAIKTLGACRGADGYPNWNFIEIRVILNPTNFNPADYTITLNARSNNKVIAQFKTTQTLEIDQKITLLYYIPIHADEVNLFDDVQVTYTRLTK
ncbi:MAG: hypothetical protein WCF90_04060 [Methanomicrobiales archaeon]